MDIYIIFIIADNQICEALGGYLHNFDYNQIWRALGGYLIFLLLRIIIFIFIADKQICRALGGYLSKFLQRILEALRQRPHQVFGPLSCDHSLQSPLLSPNIIIIFHTHNSLRNLHQHPFVTVFPFFSNDLCIFFDDI